MLLKGHISVELKTFVGRHADTCAARSKHHVARGSGSHSSQSKNTHNGARPSLSRRGQSVTSIRHRASRHIARPTSSQRHADRYRPLLSSQRERTARVVSFQPSESAAYFCNGRVRTRNAPVYTFKR